MAWNEAEEICVCCKAHLASVTSIQIQDMLAAKVAKWSRSIWIGASDQGSEGHWVWADGSPIGFSHWYVGWVGGLVLVEKIMLAHHCLTTCSPTEIIFLTIRYTRLLKKDEPDNRDNSETGKANCAQLARDNYWFAGIESIYALDH